jgi:hypothetical protein
MCGALCQKGILFCKVAMFVLVASMPQWERLRFYPVSEPPPKCIFINNSYILISPAVYLYNRVF